MCGLGRDIAQENLQKGLEQGLKQGREEGMEKECLKALRSLLANTGWSVQQAMATLKIPASDQPKYRALLQQP